MGKQNIPTQLRSLHTGHFPNKWHPTVGAEPGVDPTSKNTIGNPPQRDLKAQIKIIDYSSKQLEEHDLHINDMEAWLRDQPKPDWAATRWIWVNGLNFDVVKSLGNNNGLHPLAIEDVMDPRTSNKVDWYNDHCFLQMSLVKLAPYGG